MVKSTDYNSPKNIAKRAKANEANKKSDLKRATKVIASGKGAKACANSFSKEGYVVLDGPNQFSKGWDAALGEAAHEVESIRRYMFSLEEFQRYAAGRIRALKSTAKKDV